MSEPMAASFCMDFSACLLGLNVRCGGSHSRDSNRPAVKLSCLLQKLCLARP
jgi:hypothetical protein